MKINPTPPEVKVSDEPEPKAEAVPFTVFRVERDGHVTHTLARLGEPSLCIPAAEAREFFERAKFVAGLVRACTSEELKIQKDFMARCDKYLATLPD